MNKTTRAVYRRSFRRNKSIFAQTADGVLGTLFTYVIIAVFLRECGASSAAAGIVSILFTAVTVTVYSLITEMRFERHIRKERARVAEEMKSRELLMMPDGKFAELVHAEQYEDAILFRDNEKMPRDMLLCIYRAAKNENKKQITIITIDGADEKAAEMLKYVKDMKIDIVSADKTCLAEPADEAIDAEFVRERCCKRKKWFSAQMPSRWLVCGAVMILLSFVLRFSLYYRIIGIACMWVWAVKGIGRRV